MAEYVKKYTGVYVTAEEYWELIECKRQDQLNTKFSFPRPGQTVTERPNTVYRKLQEFAAAHGLPTLDGLQYGLSVNHEFTYLEIEKEPS